MDSRQSKIAEILQGTGCKVDIYVGRNSEWATMDWNNPKRRWNWFDWWFLGSIQWGRLDDWDWGKVYIPSTKYPGWYELVENKWIRLERNTP